MSMKFHKLKRRVKQGKRLKKEFRTQLRMFITFTFGFTIAFSWRQTTFDISQSFMGFLFGIEKSTFSEIITSTFMTIACVGLIYLSSHFLKDEY